MVKNLAKEQGALWMNQYLQTENWKIVFCWSPNRDVFQDSICTDGYKQIFIASYTDRVLWTIFKSVLPLKFVVESGHHVVPTQLAPNMWVSVLPNELHGCFLKIRMGFKLLRGNEDKTQRFMGVMRWMFMSYYQHLEDTEKSIKDEVTKNSNKQTACEFTLVYLP